MASPAPTAPVPLAVNRERQRELYGVPLGDRVRRLTAALGVTQARLARVLGLSPAMLSQLVSARRVKIGDPAVLARLMLLDRLVDRHGAGALPLPPAAVETLLDDVAGARLLWSAPSGPRPRDPGDGGAVAALRALAPPARLAAAAAALGPGFPELADALRQAACRPAGPGGPRSAAG
jgi:transcriptional regulator with XRE-family HTH domain